ncbi:MAG: FAD-dependent oxidoreductase, partial [Pseudomonadota bacterium]
TLDHNAVIGPHPEVGNFFFQNGFSGHGLQQSAAMGRGMSELLTYGAYRALDLSDFGYERVVAGVPFVEKAVI